MFFTPTLKSDLFYVHKTVRGMMIILMIAMLVMPILHQPKKSEAALDPVTWTILSLVIAGAAVYVTWKTSQPNPCPAGCGGMVEDPNAHVKSCTNCQQSVYTCLESFPDLELGEKFKHHKAYCPKDCGPNGVVPGCLTLYFICDDGTKLPSEQVRYRHRILESDCGIHHHRACLPSNNHGLDMGDCGMHHYPECSPELNHFPVDTLCDHSVYTCMVGHEDVFCDPCQIFYPDCESHECPPDDSSDCCDDSSSCCDDGS